MFAGCCRSGAIGCKPIKAIDSRMLARGVDGRGSVRRSVACGDVTPHVTINC